MIRRFKITYPEKSIVSEDRLRTWYLDLFADGKAANLGNNPDIFDVIAELQNLGVVTVAKELPEWKGP